MTQPLEDRHLKRKSFLNMSTKFLLFFGGILKILFFFKLKATNRPMKECQLCAHNVVIKDGFKSERSIKCHHVVVAVAVAIFFFGIV